jgi:hypothetical protein
MGCSSSQAFQPALRHAKTSDTLACADFTPELSFERENTTTSIVTVERRAIFREETRNTNQWSFTYDGKAGIELQRNAVFKDDGKTGIELQRNAVDTTPHISLELGLERENTTTSIVTVERSAIFRVETKNTNQWSCKYEGKTDLTVRPYLKPASQPDWSSASTNSGSMTSSRQLSEESSPTELSVTDNCSREFTFGFAASPRK